MVACYPREASYEHIWTTADTSCSGLMSSLAREQERLLAGAVYLGTGGITNNLQTSGVPESETLAHGPAVMTICGKCGPTDNR
jgi:hypothetical protein